MFSKSIENSTQQDMLNIELLKACNNLDLTEIKRLIQIGANPVFIEHHEYMAEIFSTTPFITLALAITTKLRKNVDLTNYLPLLEYFIDELKIDLNHADINGNTCAHRLANVHNGVFLLAWLSPKGLDLLKTNVKGEYPINKALSPHHNHDTVGFLSKTMSEIPMKIAKQLISLNELQETPLNKSIAKKSGEEELIAILQSESQKIIESNEAFKAKGREHQTLFFAMDMEARFTIHQTFDKLSSNIKNMNEQALISTKENLTSLIKEINHDLRIKRHSSSVNNHNFVISSTKNYDSDTDDYKSAKFYLNTEICSLEYKLKLANSTLLEINKRLHDLNIVESRSSDNSALMQM